MQPDDPGLKPKKKKKKRTPSEGGVGAAPVSEAGHPTSADDATGPDRGHGAGTEDTEDADGEAAEAEAAREVLDPPNVEVPGKCEPLPGETWGLMGYFLTPADLFKACETLRDAGYKQFDAQTPFPVHGLERAMGLPPTRLPWIILLGGVTGLSSAVALAYYTQGYDYPLMIGGKQPFSWQAFVPIFFELTVLFSAFGAFFGLWGLCGLPKPYHPTMTHPAFPRATDDAFFVSIPATDAKYDAEETRALLESLGAKEIAEVQA